MRLATHCIIVGVIAALLPGAFAQGPLWWAVVGAVLCLGNLAMAIAISRSQ